MSLYRIVTFAHGTHEVEAASIPEAKRVLAARLGMKRCPAGCNTTTIKESA